jgi:hypothetical protein
MASIFPLPVVDSPEHIGNLGRACGPGSGGSLQPRIRSRFDEASFQELITSTPADAIELSITLGHRNVAPPPCNSSVTEKQQRRHP